MDFGYNKYAITQPKLKQLWKKLEAHIDRLQLVADSDSYEAQESSIRCPFDERLHKEVLSVVARFDSTRMKYIFLVGIGGSNLAAKAVYDALLGSRDQLDVVRFPKLIFLDSVEPGIASHLDTFFKTHSLSKDEFAIIISSKSGATMETAVNAELLLATLAENRGPIGDRVIAITDEGSPLWSLSVANGYHRLATPRTVGGRFSAFTATGLLPLALAGVDTSKLLAGAQRMRTQGLSKDPSKNFAGLIAAILYNQRETHPIHDSFLFHPALESLGKWYRQLLGESIGKEFSRSKKRIYAGMTPTVSIGSTDLHSMAQLYLAGPRDKVTTFVTVGSFTAGKVLEQKVLNLAPELAGYTSGDIVHAISEGTLAAYDRQQLPYMHVTLDRLDAQSLGEYMQLQMQSIIYLAALWDIDAFDQPHVELYKREARRALARTRRTR